MAAALARDLMGALQHEDGAPRRVLLWLDPDGGFTRLRDAVSEQLMIDDVSLLALEEGDSQVELKLDLLEAEAAGRRVIVHLPGRGMPDLDPGVDGRPPALWGLVEYQYKGALWGHRGANDPVEPATLDRWLEGCGVRFSGGGARAAVIAGGKNSKLARFAARKAYLDPEQFPRPVNSAAISPAGDPRDRMIELLLSGSQAEQGWGEDAPDILEIGAETFGLEWASTDADTRGRQLAVHVAIVEAWDATGRAPSFPFAERIPKDEAARDAALSFVRKAILPRADLASRVRALVAQSTAELGALPGWANGQSGLPALLPSVIDHRVSVIGGGVAAEAQKGPQAALAMLASGLPAKGTAGRLDPRLEVMERVIALARSSSSARDRLVASPDAGSMATLFAIEAWGVDAEWFRIAEACREIAELAPIRALASRIYAAYLDAVNQRFTDLVEASGTWPPVALPSITTDADAIWARPGKAKGKRAVIVVDAMRLDIARELEARLGSSADLHARASTLPTTTPFGMSALLPGSDRAIADLSSGAALISIDGHGALETRQGRKAYLEHILKERGDNVAFVELEEILQGGAVPDVRFLVLFTYALDDQGHSAADTASLPEEAGKLPGRLARVIERLHASKVGQVDVVTDHGFLWLDPQDTDALGRPAVPGSQVTSRHERYLLLEPGAATQDVVRLGVPFAPSVEVGFPRGIRTFTKAPWYLHGGLSLQECVIPHLISRAAAAPRRVSAVFHVPETSLSTGTVAVRVNPDVDEPDGSQLQLEVPRPIRLGFEILTTGDPVRRVSEPASLELRHDSPELQTAVYLDSNAKLASGSVLTLRAYDSETSEELLRQDLKLLVGWD